MKIDQFKKWHNTLSTILIIIASAYLCIENIIGVDIEIYIIAIVNELLNKLDILKSIRGGRALDPYDFVGF